MPEPLFESSGFNSIVKGRHGYMIYNRFDRFIGRSLQKYGEFSELEVELFGQFVTPGSLVVEVGANVGAHTLPLSRMVGPTGGVVAFEPQRIIFQMLCGTMALNSIENVDCRQVIAAEKPGLRKLPRVAYHQQGNFGGISLVEDSDGETVPAVRLDDVLNLPRLDLLKIDVEGMEEEVLQGSQRLLDAHRPILYVENDRLEKSRSLIEFIGSLGYRLYWHLPPMFNPANFAGDPINVFGGLQSANMLCLHKDRSATLNGFDEILDPDVHPHRR